MSYYDKGRRICMERQRLLTGALVLGAQADHRPPCPAPAAGAGPGHRHGLRQIRNRAQSAFVSTTGICGSRGAANLRHFGCLLLTRLVARPRARAN